MKWGVTRRTSSYSFCTTFATKILIKLRKRISGIVDHVTVKTNLSKMIVAHVNSLLLSTRLWREPVQKV